jgi:hypothetical protein
MLLRLMDKAPRRPLSAGRYRLHLHQIEGDRTRSGSSCMTAWMRSGSDNADASRHELARPRRHL